VDLVGLGGARRPRRDSGFEQLIADARGRLPALEHLWRFDPALKDLVAGATEVSAEAITERAKAAASGDLATLIYTSGTTGRPKGCQLTHENLLADARNAFMGPLAPLNADANSSTLLFLPLAHSFARIIEVGTMEGGVVLGHCSDMNDLLPDLASYQPTFILAVPRVFEKVFNGAEQKAVSEGKGAIFAAPPAWPSPGAARWTPRRDRALGCVPSTWCSTGWFTASCGPLSAARRAARSPAARR